MIFFEELSVLSFAGGAFHVIKAKAEAKAKEVAKAEAFVKRLQHPKKADAGSGIFISSPPPLLHNSLNTLFHHLNKHISIHK